MKSRFPFRETFLGNYDGIIIIIFSMFSINSKEIQSGKYDPKHWIRNKQKKVQHQDRPRAIVVTVGDIK